METPETTQEVDNQGVQTEETTDTSAAQENVSNYVKDLFTAGQKLDSEGTNSEDPGSEETDQEDEVETETEESTEDEKTDEQESDEEEKEASQDKATNVLELKIGDNIEKYDVNTEEGKKKLIEFAQKGRHYEQERAKTIEQSKMVNQLANQVAYQMLFNESQGKLSYEDFIEKPYELFQGQGENEQEDLKAWNQHKESVAEKKAALRKYAEARNNMLDKFTKMTDEFKKNHPDITNADEWIAKAIEPYHAPIWTYGASEYPADTLEMIYFYQNKDKIIKAEVDKAIKDYVKKPAKKQTTSPAISDKSSDKFILPTGKIFNPDNRTLVH